MVTIAVGVEDRPASAPKDGVWVSDFKIVNHPSFSEGITAVSSLVFAYSGTPGFFNIVSEMRDPHYYTRALLICQAGVTAVYITIGCVVYYYCGSYVASPALGSAGPTMKKISYGFALPGLLVTTTLVTHVMPFAHRSLYAACTNGSVDPGKIYLYPHPPRVKAPDGQQCDPLGNMARLHLWNHPHCLRDCERDPRLQ